MPAQTADPPWWHSLGSTSFLEYAFLRWILAPSVRGEILPYIASQASVAIGERSYRVDYEIRGTKKIFAIELDGFEFHGNRRAFTYDRLRQNDLHAASRMVVRFSYDSIRCETDRCVSQLQSLLDSKFQDP